MRALIFTDVPSPVSRLLTEATMAEAAERREFDVCGFVTTNAEFMPSLQTRLRTAGRHAVRRMTGERTPRHSFDLERLSRDTGLPILVPEDNVNDAAFVDRMHDELRPDVLLSYFCTQILKAPLLDSFAQAVNYHDGLLPHYGGLAATSHSVYEQAPTSGYTFHRMTTDIDAGAILTQGEVPVGSTDTGRSVGRAKAAAAATDVANVLDMVARREPGTEQVGKGSYYCQKAATDIMAIADPSTVTSADIRRRLRAFGSIRITLDGATEHVTGLADAQPGDRFAFATADGHLRASHLGGIPAPLIAVRRKLRR